MRKMLLSLVLFAAALGGTVATPSKADAGPFRRWTIGYPGYYYPGYVTTPGGFTYSQPTYATFYSTPTPAYFAPGYNTYYSTPAYTSYYYAPGFTSYYNSPSVFIYP